MSAVVRSGDRSERVPGGAPADRTALELRGVSKRFGWTWALREVDLRVERGELLALMGPNGAGKTTLLRLVATLLRPTAGSARVLGHELSEVGEIRRRLGYLAPEGYLYDQLTARENLRFAALMSGESPDPTAIASALTRVGLERVADVQVGGFSSGMRKRLALGRLLLRPLRMVLLDEPYASLDSDGTGLVDDLVEQLHGEGRTVVLASHRWGRALPAADRVVLLEGGRVAWTGTPGEHARRAGGEEA